MQAAVRAEAPARAEMSAGALLLAIAHLAVDEAGALMLLRLHCEATGELPADEASLAALSRLGANWFRRPHGGESTRGARVLAALHKCGVVPAAASAPAVPAASAPAAAAGLSSAQLDQRRRAANSRWDVFRGSGQMELPLPATGDSEKRGPVAVPPAGAMRSPPPRRPDVEEIPDELALEYVRGWLYQYAGRVKIPDLDTCRNVLAAARGATMWALYGAINDLFVRGFRVGKTWGWFVVCVRNYFSPGGDGGVAAPVAG
jgi:hypothetical protein